MAQITIRCTFTKQLIVPVSVSFERTSAVVDVPRRVGEDLVVDVRVLHLHPRVLRKR